MAKLIQGDVPPVEYNMTQLGTSSATTFTNPVYELESDIGSGTMSSTRSSVVPGSVDTGYVTEPSSSVIGKGGVMLLNSRA